jgi:hypothetical protein
VINSEDLESFIVESLTIAPNQRHIEGTERHLLCFPNRWSGQRLVKRFFANLGRNRPVVY